MEENQKSKAGMKLAKRIEQLFKERRAEFEKIMEEFIIELFEKGNDEKEIRELTGLSEQEIKKIIENAKMQAPSME